ncbi:GNAT family N-acetyltransferase, partial [bacterium]|nr:GNAT family N-acetyltransferase [bacterium]
MNVELACHDDAAARLRDPSFRESWAALHARCPWATGFQSPGFGLAWYDSYAEAFTPMLLASRSADGSLAGLLALAEEKATGRLVVAGDRQAEYRGWLAEPDDADAFIQAALAALAGRSLFFGYLPPGTPTGWVTEEPARSVCELEAHPRPLMRLGDPDAIARSLRKKSNRSRLNRLARIGEVRLEQITDPAAFAPLLDELAALYDLRQGAAYNKVAFRDDPHKRAFHVRLHAEPGLLHATVLWAGDQLAAAHVGVRSGPEVHLGIIAHSPRLAMHSPGKLLLLLLAERLGSEGVETLDITPGGAEYKERFANDHDQVHLLAVHGTPRQRTMHRVVRGLERTARRALALC